MWDTLLEHCSEDRLNKYLGKVAEDRLAAEFMYVANHKVSESLYPLISILEVSLRNRIHSKLLKKFGRSDWWIHGDLNVHAFVSSKEKIDRARTKIYHRDRSLTKKQHVKASQLVAEVSLNFWTSLFSEDLSQVLWKDLMECFPLLPKESRKRRSVARPLENITKLRNRVMHHEPVLFDESAQPSDLHFKGAELLTWMSADMAKWQSKIDRFQDVWGEYKTVRDQMNTWLDSRSQLKSARDTGVGDLRPFYLNVEREKAAFDDLANNYLLNAKVKP